LKASNPLIIKESFVEEEDSEGEKKKEAEIELSRTMRV